MAQIYLTTNLLNNKIYIGQTNAKRKSYIGGGDLLKKAIKKYGKDNFKREIIVEGEFNQKLIDELEIHYINLFNSTNSKIGYNLKPGGYGNIKGFKMSEEAKKKIGLASTGRKRTYIITEELRHAYGNGNRGRKQSKGEIERRSKSISKSLTGKKLSEAHKTNLSTASKNKPKKKASVERMRNSMINNLGNSRAVTVHDSNNNLIGEFPSLSECARILKISSGNIAGYCSGKSGNRLGYVFKYKEDSIVINQYTLDDVFINSYSSTLDASNSTNIGVESIRKSCLKGKNAGGYIFKRELKPRNNV